MTIKQADIQHGPQLLEKKLTLQPDIQHGPQLLEEEQLLEELVKKLLELLEEGGPIEEELLEELQEKLFRLFVKKDARSEQELLKELQEELEKLTFEELQETLFQPLLMRAATSEQLDIQHGPKQLEELPEKLFRLFVKKAARSEQELLEELPGRMIPWRLKLLYLKDHLNIKGFLEKEQLEEVLEKLFRLKAATLKFFQHLLRRDATSAQTSRQAASSFIPSCSSPPRWIHDVFLSFRGDDTRNSFTAHLCAALRRKGIKAYIDDRDLERGKIIEPTLWKAIEESRFSIVIFSRDYACSPWCLDELDKIVQCMTKMKHIVLPVFYHVDPSEVANQTGNYETAFVKHEEDFKENMEKLRS